MPLIPLTRFALPVVLGLMVFYVFCLQCAATVAGAPDAVRCVHRVGATAATFGHRRYVSFSKQAVMDSIRKDARFMAGMGIVLLSMSAFAFAPRYFVPISLGIYEAPSTWMHPHAISALLWNLIFIAQPLLIATDNVSLHRRVGLAAIVVAVANVVSGIGVQVDLLPADPENFSLIVGSAFRLFQSVPTFVIFLAAALVFRRHTAYHLRFMYQTAFAAVGTVVGRLYSYYLAVPEEVVGPLIGITSLAFVLVLPVYDKIRYARVHPASWIGLAAFVVFQVFVAGYVLNSDWWAAIATVQP